MKITELKLCLFLVICFGKMYKLLNIIAYQIEHTLENSLHQNK